LKGYVLSPSNYLQLNQLLTQMEQRQQQRLCCHVWVKNAE